MMEGVSVEAIQEGSERREGGQTVAARQDPVVRGGEDMWIRGDFWEQEGEEPV